MGQMEGGLLALPVPPSTVPLSSPRETPPLILRSCSYSEVYATTPASRARCTTSSGQSAVNPPGLRDSLMKRCNPEFIVEATGIRNTLSCWGVKLAGCKPGAPGEKGEPVGESSQHARGKKQEMGNSFLITSSASGYSQTCTFSYMSQ